MPQIPNSGPISLSDFATEFGGTAPHSMSEYYRNGANVPSNNSNVPTAGAFRFGQMRGAINEIILAATSGANVDLSSLFGANWTSTVPKRLTVPRWCNYWWHRIKRSYHHPIKHGWHVGNRQRW